MRGSAQDVLWMGFDGLDAESFPEGFTPGGIVVFAKNLDPDPVAGPLRLRRMLDGLQERLGPLAVAIDQEGGAVSRLKTWVGPTPNLRDLWLAGGAEACRTWGGLWGRGLRLLGIGVDFAPVADRFDGHLGTGLERRCASEDPLEAAMAAGAFLEGLEATGVRGCLKHFPGLGGTRVDSHKALPEILDPGMLQANLVPFQMLAHADRLVMVGHVKTPHSEGLPSSLYPGSVARNPWGVQARWVPDAMEMGGCAVLDWEARVRLALEAGHEAILVCMPHAEVVACAEALGRLAPECWREAALRFRQLRDRLAPALPWDAAAWSAWVAEVQAASRAIESGTVMADPTQVR